jgi:hypothetical protein
MKSASRTLVKSQPELWELIDQPDRMQGLMSGLLGHATEVSVDERDPESRLRWKADGEEAWIRVQLAEKGWGTHVEVSASKAKESISLEGWLDAVLEELATPEKRPFSAGKTEKRVIETPVDEPEPEPSEPEPPVEAQQTPVEPAPESPGKKLRRFFGL